MQFPGDDPSISCLQNFLGVTSQSIGGRGSSGDGGWNANGSVALTFKPMPALTVEAAQAALLSHGPTLNLLGGFHHAAPERGGGLCEESDARARAPLP